MKWTFMNILPCNIPILVLGCNIIIKHHSIQGIWWWCIANCMFNTSWHGYIPVSHVPCVWITMNIYVIFLWVNIILETSLAVMS